MTSNLAQDQIAEFALDFREREVCIKPLDAIFDPFMTDASPNQRHLGSKSDQNLTASLTQAGSRLGGYALALLPRPDHPPDTQGPFQT